MTSDIARGFEDAMLSHPPPDFHHMPRYFFNVHDGTDIPDNGGFELPGEEEARLEAVRLAGTLIRDGARAFWINRKWSLDVRDSVGDFQFTLDFKATLKKPQGWTINLHGQE